MHKRTKLCQFSKETKQFVFNRDGGCVFCQMMYNMPPEPIYELTILDTMHIVNRSQGGLGIPQNGICGCRYHHSMLDNGNKGLRGEMLGIIYGYMKRIYPGWDKEKLVYKKGTYNLAN